MKGRENQLTTPAPWLNRDVALLIVRHVDDPKVLYALDRTSKLFRVSTESGGKTFFFPFLSLGRDQAAPGVVNKVPNFPAVPCVQLFRDENAANGRFQVFYQPNKTNAACGDIGRKLCWEIECSASICIWNGG
jgi:hypothetical protein